MFQKHNVRGVPLYDPANHGTEGVMCSRVAYGPMLLMAAIRHGLIPADQPLAVLHPDTDPDGVYDLHVATHAGLHNVATMEIGVRRAGDLYSAMRDGEIADDTCCGHCNFPQGQLPDVDFAHNFHHLNWLARADQVSDGLEFVDEAPYLRMGRPEVVLVGEGRILLQEAGTLPDDDLVAPQLVEAVSRLSAHLTARIADVYDLAEPSPEPDEVTRMVASRSDPDATEWSYEVVSAWGTTELATEAYSQFAIAMACGGTLHGTNVGLRWRPALLVRVPADLVAYQTMAARDTGYDPAMALWAFESYEDTTVNWSKWLEAFNAAATLPKLTA